MADPKFLTGTRGAVLVTIARSAGRTAIDAAAARELQRAWDLLDDDAALRAGIITGAGGAFSAGAGLKAAAAGQAPARTPERGIFGIIGQPPRKPVLAAVEGDARGAGFELALARDLIAASPTGRFGLPECRLKVLAVCRGAARLPLKIPVNLAMETLLTGAPQPAARLHALGLVDILCAPGTALATALSMAEQIAANDPLAVAAARRVVRDVAEADAAAGWARQQAEWDALRASPYYHEVIAAFAEKRPPQWRGQ